ncbi:hypothetical protein POPTR_018G034950v4 [Populus trichocarpa]|uniref:Uncharacterized protein n=1 Tax=Populus trichocarpa TaxID=3694 RepID=A0ACC0RLI8_POPTR|nr:hypothetical protein POPTR_018G034950v4 [Populus trichocarpa]
MCQRNTLSMKIEEKKILCVFVTSDGDMECLSEYMVVCWGDDAWQLGHLLLLSHFRSSVFTSLCFDCHLLF